MNWFQVETFQTQLGTGPFTEETIMKMLHNNGKNAAANQAMLAQMPVVTSDLIIIRSEAF